MPDDRRSEGDLQALDVPRHCATHDGQELLAPDLENEQCEREHEGIAA
jgi:hypothetical protein